jgi:hypothetical protein
MAEANYTKYMCKQTKINYSITRKNEMPFTTVVMWG